MRWLTFCSAAWCLSSAWTGATLARAGKPSFDIQLFHPVAGTTGLLGAETGELMPHLAINAGLSLNYARDPLSISILTKESKQSSAGAVVKHRLDTTVLAAIGLFNRIELGLAAPLVAQSGLDSASFSAARLNVGVNELAQFAPGDIRIIPKIKAFSLTDGILALAVVPTVVVPTAGGRAYAGEGGVVFSPMLALSSRLAALRLALNVGLAARSKATVLETIKVQHDVLFHTGAALDLNRGGLFPFEVVGEVFGRTPMDDPFGMQASAAKRATEKARTAVEFELGVRTKLMEHFLITFGTGGGLTGGYGSPLPRILASVSYYTDGPAMADVDGDRIADEIDACVDKPEDVDRFQDDDGCPDLDNDGDGILDEDDSCADEAEDLDNFQDEDGCPDTDNDRDGIVDTQDKCPNEPEDRNGTQDEDGCPEQGAPAPMFLESPLFELDTAVPEVAPPLPADNRAQPASPANKRGKSKEKRGKGANKKGKKGAAPPGGDAGGIEFNF